MTLDLPSNREEAWRWADIGGIAAAAVLAPIARPDAAFLDLPGAKLLFVDGVLDDAASDLHRVRIGDLAPGTHALGKRATKGWSLHLDAQAVAHPVQVVHIATGGDNHVAAEIVLGPDTSAQVVETFVGAGWSNRNTRITLGKAARLMRAVRMTQAGGFVSIRDEAELGEGASLVGTMLAAGDQGVRIDAAITLAGEGGYAEYGGALLTRDRLKQECAVRVRHAEPTGQSHQLWRAVSADRSQASLAAAVEVARHAQKTDGEQSLRGLLLHRTATVNLKPELEIFADDVKCAHGATVGELDARALFYMESRGIPAARAKALLTKAFVADALDRIADVRGETSFDPGDRSFAVQVREAFAADADAWLESAL